MSAQAWEPMSFVQSSSTSPQGEDITMASPRSLKSMSLSSDVSPPMRSMMASRVSPRVGMVMLMTGITVLVWIITAGVARSTKTVPYHRTSFLPRQSEPRRQQRVSFPGMRTVSTVDLCGQRQASHIEKACPSILGSGSTQTSDRGRSGHGRPYQKHVRTSHRRSWSCSA